MPVAAYLPRVALVTGAAQGIGRAIASRLAHDGVNVAVNDIPQKKEQLNELVSEIKAMSREAVAITADLAKEEDTKNMIQETVSSLGSLDIMVANAGLAKGGPLIDFSTEDIDRLIAVNLRGVIFSYKYACMQMIKQGRGGRIIGASSGIGKKGTANLAAYSATKFGVRGLTQSMAMELAPHDITVNAYVPGTILTPMLQAVVDGFSKDKSIDDPWAHARKMMGLPLDAPIAGPEVVASLVSYLCKPEAYFITGQSISVTGALNLTFD
ncbi:NAD-P-binding protein [Panus rudis PR-1116 ss-1]|nr:NAD-P-binding protein [Panus rudis PR-1116 ss-1]